MGVGFQIPIKNLVSILVSTAVKTARVAAGELRRTIPLSPKGTEFPTYRDIL
jgi:hypothetical protein